LHDLILVASQRLASCHSFTAASLPDHSAAIQFAQEVEVVAVFCGMAGISVAISAQARLPVPPKPSFRRVYPQAESPRLFITL
jgi:hypothetical protein